MDKLISIVTTCLVVLSSRFYFWKNWLRRWNPRRTVMGTTDRWGGLVPKHLDFWNLGSEIDSLNFVTEWQDGLSQAWRTVTGPSVNFSLWTLRRPSRTDRRRHDDTYIYRISRFDTCTVNRVLHFDTLMFGMGSMRELLWLLCLCLLDIDNGKLCVTQKW